MGGLCLDISAPVNDWWQGEMLSHSGWLMLWNWLLPDLNVSLLGAQSAQFHKLVLLQQSLVILVGRCHGSILLINRRLGRIWLLSLPHWGLSYEQTCSVPSASPLLYRTSETSPITSSLAHSFEHSFWTFLTFSWPSQLLEIQTKDANQWLLYLRGGVGFGFTIQIVFSSDSWNKCFCREFYFICQHTNLCLFRIFSA